MRVFTGVWPRTCSSPNSRASRTLRARSSVLDLVSALSASLVRGAKMLVPSEKQDTEFCLVGRKQLATQAPIELSLLVQSADDAPACRYRMTKQNCGCRDGDMRQSQTSCCAASHRPRQLLRVGA